MSQKEQIQTVWQRETDRWVLTEYEIEPRVTTVTLLSQHSKDFSCHFGRLGIEKEKFDHFFDDDDFNWMSWFVANNATSEGWNITPCDFWFMVQNYLPSAKEYEQMCAEEDEQHDPEISETLATIWGKIDGYKKTLEISDN